jgi:Bacterial-like globin
VLQMDSASAHTITSSFSSALIRPSISYISAAALHTTDARAPATHPHPPRRFRSIFASSTKEEAIANQVDFLTERLGGEPRYTARKGKHHRLIGRHAPYALTPRSADRWVEVRAPSPSVCVCMCCAGASISASVTR